jgi:hypothetical protein
MSMITYLWILKTQKYCGVLFVKQNMQMLMICPNDLLYEKKYEIHQAKWDHSYEDLH